MKRKICVRSMFLGAVIMLIGLAVGAIVSPPLVAQHNGVFDVIQCRRLEVVDKHGKKAILLTSNDDVMNGIAVFDKHGQVGVALTTNSDNQKGDQEALNAIYIYNGHHGQIGISLAASEGVNHIGIDDANGNPRVLLSSSKFGDGIAVYDQARNVVGSIP